MAHTPRRLRLCASAGAMLARTNDAQALRSAGRLDSAHEMATPAAVSPPSVQGSFLCVCSEKCVQVSADFKLERAFQSLAIKRHLEKQGGELPNKQFMYLPGAGFVFDSERCFCAIEDYLIAVFVGCVHRPANVAGPPASRAAPLQLSLGDRTCFGTQRCCSAS